MFTRQRIRRISFFAVLKVLYYNIQYRRNGENYKYGKQTGNKIVRSVNRLCGVLCEYNKGAYGGAGRGRREMQCGEEKC